MQHGKTIKKVNLPRRLVLRGWIAALMLSILPGCVTPWEKSALMKDNTPDIKGVKGPEERRLSGLFRLRKQEEAAADENDSLKPLPGTDAFVAAKELYRDDQFKEAENAFKKVAKKYKKSDIREDAIFMQGEAAFRQEHYADANDLYAQLLKEYPSTRYLDVVSDRLFKIGRIWLDFPEVAKLGEIEQINFEDPKRKLPAEEPPKLNKTPIFVPNFFDEHKPTFDTPGNGVAALQLIWMNDPTGPLADDAMMLVASHYARKGNYIEADRYFRMLRETFPNSPHLRDAFLIGSHVKLMAYQGANYDDKTLSDAQMLKESTIRLYPEMAEVGRLKDELTRIEQAKAERDWQLVELYARKGNKRAVAVMCHQLISHYPKSDQADKARERLQTMGPEYESGAVVLNPTDPPKVLLWQRVIPGQQQPSMATPAARPEPATANPYADDPKSEQSPSRWMSNPFRRRSAPTTDPVEESSSESDEGAEIDLNDTPKKKSWLWPAPRRLPSEADTDARKLDVGEISGKTKL
ncbi:MAG: outer membrane protein assembly factor BamD [Planctomycetota bacterium]